MCVEVSDELPLEVVQLPLVSPREHFDREVFRSVLPDCATDCEVGSSPCFGLMQAPALTHRLNGLPHISLPIYPVPDQIDDPCVNLRFLSLQGIFLSSIQIETV